LPKTTTNNSNNNNICAAGFARSVAENGYNCGSARSQRGEKRLFPGHEFSPEGVRRPSYTYAAAAAAAAATRSTSFLPAFVVLPTDYFIMFVFSAEKYYRKIIITITPPTVMLLSRAHTHTHPREHE